MRKYKYLFGIAVSVLLSGLVFLQSCKKDPEEYNGVRFTSDGKLTLNFNNKFGEKPLKYAPDSFFIASGDTVKITQLAYYISNITLEKESGEKLNLNTYHLIKEDVPASKTVILNNIPKGDYKSISVLLGVDSARNHSGAQDGDLDPNYGMIWTWNTGYIFFRIKGRFGKDEKAISYDVGGDDHTVKYTFPLTGVKVSAANVQMQMQLNVAEFFSGPNTINLQTDKPDVHTNTDTEILPRLYENMKDMLSLTGIY